MIIPYIQYSLILVFGIACFAYVMGRVLIVQKAAGERRHLASLPGYYGWYCALSALLAAAVLGLIGWIFPVPSVITRTGLPLAAMVGAAYSCWQLRPGLPAQVRVEAMIRRLLAACGGVAIATTLGIILSLVFETGRFFGTDGVNALEFFTGLEWSAQTAAAFGAVPVFFGTFFIALIAIGVAGPIGLFSAIYLSEYASPHTRRIVKPVIEVLAGVPTVVYGFFALLVVAPFIRELGDGINALLHPLTGGVDVLETQPRNALSAGLVMGIMIIPLISSLSDDVLRTVPAKLRNGALGLGATQSEMLKHIVLPTARPGLMAVLLLAISRAIGETMIVVMAAGERANITLNPFEDMTTVTVQIVAMLTGDPEFDNPRTLSAFALGAVLFAITLIFNMIAQRIVERQRGEHVRL